MAFVLALASGAMAVGHPPARAGADTVRGYRILVRGRTALPPIPIKECGFVEPKRPLKRIGDFSKVGSFEITTYVAGTEEAQYATSWLFRHDPKACTVTVEEHQKITLRHNGESTVHRYDGGRKDPHWEFFSNAMPKEGGGLLAEWYLSNAVRTGRTEAIEGHLCEIWENKPDPDAKAEMCLLSKDDTTSGRALAGQLLRWSLEGRLSRTEARAVSISREIDLDRSLFRPPADARIVHRDSTTPLDGER